MSAWFSKVGYPGQWSDHIQGKKGGRRRDNRDDHDGTELEPVKVEQDEASLKEKNVEQEKEKEEKTEQQATAKPLGKFAKICCLGALFWGAVDVHSRLRKEELTDAEKERKRDIIFNLTENFPLSQFEREFCTIHTFKRQGSPIRVRQ